MSKFPTLSQQSLEIQLPLCSQDSAFFSRAHSQSTRKREVDGKDFAQVFSSLSPIWRPTEVICLQNCCHPSVPCLSNPHIGLQQSLLCEPALRACWSRKRPHKPFETRQSHAVPRELYQLHICFQMKSS